MPVERKEDGCVSVKVKTLAEIRREKQQQTHVEGKCGPFIILTEHWGSVK